MKDIISKYLMSWSKQLLVYVVIALAVWSGRRELRIFTTSLRVKDSRIIQLESRDGRQQNRIAQLEHALTREIKERRFLELKVDKIGKAQKQSVKDALAAIEDVHNLTERTEPIPALVMEDTTYIPDLPIVEPLTLAELSTTEPPISIATLAAGTTTVRRSFLRRLFNIK
jgi:uncharacterized coiled-coil protein SlyX